MDRDAHDTLDAGDSAAPKMWQLWGPFSGLTEWYFAEGCPPPLRRVTGWTRRLHASVLCGAMGFIAGVFGLLVSRLVSPLVPRRYAWIRTLLLGVSYGFIVIYPLSRWLGRGVIASLAKLVGCALCLGSISFTATFVIANFSRELKDWGPAWVSFWTNVIVFGIPNFLIALMMLGMHPRAWKSLLAVALVVMMFAGAVACQPRINQFWPAAIRQLPLFHATVSSLPYVWFNMLFAVALGMQLWPQLRDPEIAQR